MNYAIAKECSLLSEQEKITFPEVVARLGKAGVELYYTDLLAPSKTYYSKSEAYVVPGSLESEKVLGPVFNSDAVAHAIRQIQTGKIQYQEFLRLIMEAGVISYFVFIKGRKAIYFGKLGEQHVESFPS